MKKLAFFTLLILLQQVATAQSNYQSRSARRDTKDFSYGFKAAWNIANISHSDIDETIEVVPQHKLSAGGFAMYRPFDDFALSAELLYSQQGCNFDIPYTNPNQQQEEIDFTNDIAFELQYLNLPILINWYVPIVPGLAVKSGVQPGFLLSSKFTYWGVTEDTPALHTRSVDVSIPVGLSYELDFGLMFDIRYNIGLTNVFELEADNVEDYDGINYSSSASNTNSVWQFSLGFRF